MRHHFLCGLMVVGLLITCPIGVAKEPSHDGFGKVAHLPLPSSLPIQSYERKLYRWLMQRKYQKLGWHHDRRVRDTGPFIQGVSYGTHPAVRIFYSPQVMQWLVNGREGALPDGSIIVKEMFHPPARLYVDMANNPKYQDAKEYQTFLNDMTFSWTVMVKDSGASKDGWFWANPGAPKQDQSIKQAIRSQLDDLEKFPTSEFGAPCLRCHASAESDSTFADLRNVRGPDLPYRFRVDNSWRSPSHFSTYPLCTLVNDPYVKSHFILPSELRPGSDPDGVDVGCGKHEQLGYTNHSPVQRSTYNQAVDDQPLPDWNPQFVETFNQINPNKIGKVQAFPSVWTDQVLPPADHPEEYLTSDNCLGCHGGLGGDPSGVTMFAQTGPNYGDGYNLSEYGEWRWSPMGLAGRDPIFHAQLESEMAYLERDAKHYPNQLKGSLEANKNAVTNTCLSCHGAMGQRQLAIDAKTDPALDANFSVDYLYLEPPLKRGPNPKYLKYGALAREGVSCAVCHHIDKASSATIADWYPPKQWVTKHTDIDLAYTLFHNTTGRFNPGPADEFFGPFTDVSIKPMEHTLGITPVHNAFTSDSLMCGTCHTINLPNIGQPINPNLEVLNAAETNPAFKDYQHSIEQATFLEWQNSAFAKNPDGKNSQFASCQDCHMPGGFKSLDNSVQIDQIVTQIAAIQDDDFPQSDNEIPRSDLHIPVRDDYARHEHVGLNVFLLEMFDQFPEVLGVTKKDPMTYATNGTDLAIENMLVQARDNTADIEVLVESADADRLVVRVNIRNKTGHRFPSGVAFRRAFVELLVKDGDNVVWGSGRTNKAGVIVGGNIQPLPSEFLPNAQTYQRHYQIIDSQDKVQIYEELNQNAQHEFTTSFVHRVFDIKDNRLLPDGWRESEYFAKDGAVMQQFMEATDPHGVGDDPDYKDHGDAFVGRDSLKYKITLPKGTNSSNLQVEATLYSQAIPPFWLKERFEAAPRGKATQRLFYLAGRLNLEGTPMQDWKLKLVSDKVNVH